MKSLSPLLLILLTATIAPADEPARRLLDKAQDFIASAPSISRIDTSEITVTGPNIKLPPQKNTVTIEIDSTRHLARQTSTFEGRTLIMIKSGEKAAMRLGDGPWQIPTGPFERLEKNLGNLFVCETEVPENQQSAPQWQVTGSETLDGRQTVTIESAGESAVAIAQQRASRGVADAIPDPAKRPQIKVLSYHAKHWIDKADSSHRQALQVSTMRVTLPQGNITLTQEMRSTSKYSYDPVHIVIPEEANKILLPAKHNQ